LRGAARASSGAQGFMRKRIIDASVGIELVAADDPAAVVDFGAPFVVTVADGLFVVSTP